MREYLLRRLLLAVPVVLGVATLVFFLIRWIPGDPVALMLGESAQPADVQALRVRLGLDRPWYEQYPRFLTGLARADLGTSIVTNRPVRERVLERFPATLELTLASMLAGCLIAFPLGVAAAVRRDTWVDRGGMVAALLGISIPNFWLGPMLVILFAVHLHWLPPSGRGGPLHYILPAITLGTALAAMLARMVRASLLETLRADYVTAARAKGISPARAVLAHALRNALLPVVTIMGLQFGSLLAGSIITETIFAWPGVGKWMYEAVMKRDYMVIQGGTLFIAAIFVTINLCVDVLYAVINPRISVK